ncbi:MAG TPA: hypothetical protein PK781_02370 [Terrimesophilobacter sp.]|nr:hypothetical protein [Terrimesophilobacter sp.]
MNRTALAVRIIVPALWLGMILALSFLEAPLKFQAPGITTELGLGIGRLVFTALNISSIVLLAIVTLALIRPRSGRLPWGIVGGMWVVLLVEVLLIRPSLNARTDQLLAGIDPGPSMLHYLYIAADVILCALIVWFIVVAVRQILPTAEPGRVHEQSRGQ